MGATSIQIRRTDAGPAAVETERPAPNAGEIIVSTRAAAVSASELAAPNGLVMCGEFSGEVMEVGADVERDLIGAEVAILGYEPCGSCARCVAGLSSACAELGVRGLTIDGGLADALVVRAADAIPLPAGLAADDAVFMHRIASALHAIRRGPARPGDDVAIVGSTPLALAMSAVALSAGFGRVSAVEKHAACRAALAPTGAHLLDAPADASGWDELRAWFGGFGPDVVFECVGTPESRLAAIELTRPAGSVVTLSDDPEPVPMDINLLVMGDKRVVGSRVYTRADAEAALALMARARVDLSALAAARMSVSELLTSARQGALAETCQTPIVTWPRDEKLTQDGTA